MFPGLSRTLLRTNSAHVRSCKTLTWVAPRALALSWLQQEFLNQINYILKLLQLHNTGHIAVNFWENLCNKHNWNDRTRKIITVYTSLATTTAASTLTACCHPKVKWSTAYSWLQLPCFALILSSSFNSPTFPGFSGKWSDCEPHFMRHVEKHTNKAFINHRQVQQQFDSYWIRLQISIQIIQQPTRANTTVQ